MPRPGRLLFPAFPKPKALPWGLAGVSALALVYGLVTSGSEAAILGAAGLAATVVGFPLARLLLGEDDPADEPAPPGDLPPR